MFLKLQLVPFTEELDDEIDSPSPTMTSSPDCEFSDQRHPLNVKIQGVYFLLGYIKRTLLADDMTPPSNIISVIAMMVFSEQ